MSTAQELSAVRKQYMQQTAEVAKLSEQYGAIRASSDSAAVELQAARKQLSMAKAEAELAMSDRIDLMKENSHLRQEFTQAMAHIASLQQDMGKLCAVQKDFEEAHASLERCRHMHAIDREQILRLEEELKAFAEKEKHSLLIQREADLAKRQNAQLLKELQDAQEALKAFQEVTERNCWLEDERKRLLAFEIECDRMRARLVLEETRIKEINEKHAEAMLQLNRTLADEKALKHELERQANEIAMLATDLRSANQREAEKAEQLRIAVEEARRFEMEAQRRLEDIARLEAENAKITKELECYSRKHFEDLTESLAEKQKLKVELDAAAEYSSRLSMELELMKESSLRQKEELRNSREETTALSNKVQELMRQADINKLEATLEALRQELMHKNSNEKEVLSRMKLQLQEAEQQHEGAVAKKKQLRTQLMEATRALHLTRDLAEKCATLETKLEEMKRYHDIEAAKRQRDNLEVRRQQQELASCRKLLQSLQLTQRELEECCRKKDAELIACKAQAERESIERAETEAAWARTIEEQVQQRVSVLEKDFALRIAKYATLTVLGSKNGIMNVGVFCVLAPLRIRKKVAERAEYNHLLDELLAAGKFPLCAALAVV
ncbi:Myosin-9, related [Eimeria brunetti]|uniref:Myosin-9, related n=1 Tax=Eimeria brunetti TaxID=51314 RepID=U6LUJ3_9EIME|nr:Myosin-9, related [Eimeria brunetti]